jgi:glutathione peroxidase-family protein
MNRQAVTMKKKWFFSFVCLLPVVLFAQDSLYALKFRDLYSREISLADFRGKKLVIAIFNASDPGKHRLLALDTLCRAERRSLNVVAIPAVDFGDTLPVKAMQSYFQSLGLHYIISAPGMVKKKAGGDQHPLAGWLTHQDRNGHYDQDADDPSALYVVDEEGRLYALLKERTDPNGKLMKRVLARQKIQPKNTKPGLK